MRPPKFDMDAQPRRMEILRKRFEKMEGKTVKKVSCGKREHNDELHESDVLQIEFTDDSTLYIETASNVQNIMQKVNSENRQIVKAPDFHGDLHPTWDDPEE